jgi:hypothetical protein
MEGIPNKSFTHPAGQPANDDNSGRRDKLSGNERTQAGGPAVRNLSPLTTSASHAANSRRLCFFANEGSRGLFGPFSTPGARVS